MKKYTIDFYKDILGEELAFVITVECESEKHAEDIRFTLASRYSLYASIRK